MWVGSDGQQSIGFVTLPFREARRPMALAACSDGFKVSA